MSLQPDERAQKWLLSISASDRVGLLYSVARVLAKHKVNLLLAKISTLGERVEDTFLVDGAVLQQNKAQLEIETELLDALQVGWVITCEQTLERLYACAMGCVRQMCAET